MNENKINLVIYHLFKLIMSKVNEYFTAGDGVIAARQQFKENFKNPVQSSAVKKTTNVYQQVLHPIACWKIDDIYFDFDKSFIKQKAVLAFSKLKELNDQLTREFRSVYKETPQFSLFGHADPVGQPDYNKILSENRAIAVYGVITNNPEKWKEIFKKKDDIIYLQKRLNGTKLSEKESFYDGPINGIMDTKTENAVRSYMEYLFPKEAKFSDENFLGKGKYAYQGCSEYNPVLMFSYQEDRELNKPKNKKERDRQNQINRRVTGFFFRPGLKNLDEFWPCKFAPDIQSCYTQLLEPKKLRLSFQDENRREHGVTNVKEHGPDKDTFVCKFYSQVASDSKCETYKLFLPEIRLHFERTKYEFLINFKEYKLTIPYIEVGEKKHEERDILEWVDERGHKHTIVKDSFWQNTDLERLEMDKGERVFGESENFITHCVKTRLEIVLKEGKVWYILYGTVYDKKNNLILSKGVIKSNNLFDIGGEWVLTGSSGGGEIWRKVSTLNNANGLWYDPKSRKYLNVKQLKRRKLPSEENLEEKLTNLYKQLCKNSDSIHKMIENE